MARIRAGRKLTTKLRKRLRKTQFGDPANRKFPIDTPARAANAKARATQQRKKGNISKTKEAEIKRRANEALRRFGFLKKK